MNRILTYIDWLLFILVSLLVTYIIASVIGSFLSTNPQEVTCSNKKKVYVTTNGVHLYLVLPHENINQELHRKLGFKSQFISFGWGDKEFYTSTPEWKDLTISTAFTALFENSPAAMHVSRYNQLQMEWRPLLLCPEQLENLNKFITNYFAGINSRQLTKIANVRGYSHNDRFYEANGSYTLFSTSNVWVNNALKEAQVKTSIWSPFDFGVLYHLEND